MKKFVLDLVLGIVTLFSLNSCISGAYAQDVVISDRNGDIDVSLIITYGTPYYFEGSILYYLYEGWYYYPYLYNNYYYYYRYTRPLPPPRPGHRFIPKYDDRPQFRHHRDYRPMRSSTFGTGTHKPRVDNHSTRPDERPKSTFSRPNTQPKGNNSVGNRPSTPQIRGNNNIGNRPTPQTRTNTSIGGSRPTPQMRSGGGGASHGDGRPSSGGGHFGGRR